MTEPEREAIVRLLNSVSMLNAALESLATRLVNAEAAIGQIHRRLQLQEAGAALYEIEQPGRSLN